MTSRRAFVGGSLAVASQGLMRSVRAQGTPGPRVGLIYGGTASDGVPLVAALRAGLQDLGYRDGDNMTLDMRFADYSAERATAHAAELAALKAAVVVANGAGITAACRVTPSLPVVFLHSGDPVVAGFVDGGGCPASSTRS